MPRLPEHVLFLPGASGDRSFWAPVSDQLADWMPDRATVGWPGFDGLPADPEVRRLEDLAALVVARLDRPTLLVAQSMGGVVAVLAAAQRPERVTHLVLCALSGGFDRAALGARDWTEGSDTLDPGSPMRLFAHYAGDLEPLLASLPMPVLPITGDADPISPPRVAQWLAARTQAPHIEHVVGGDHALAKVHAAEVAGAIRRFVAPSLSGCVR